MRYSPESLLAFVEAAALGSFSAAARKLGKTQSTVSTAIANFEADVGCSLFDRTGRTPVLNDAGRLVLTRVQAILGASEQLDALSVRLVGGAEPLLSVVMTDIYSVGFYGEIMERFAVRFPDTELRCGPSEDADVVEMIQSSHVQLGILAAQQTYPADVAHERLPEEPQFGVYVGSKHRLASALNIKPSHLETERQLYIRTYAPGSRSTSSQAWSAPDYLTLMEFAGRGFGWAELPRTLVDRFGRDLVELKIPGYPRSVAIDVAWSRRNPLGPAGQWLVEQMLSAAQDRPPTPST